MTLRRHRSPRRRSAGLLVPLLLLAFAAPAFAQDTGDQHSGTGDQHSGGETDQHSGTGDQHSGGETDQGPRDSPTTTAAPTTTAPPEAPGPEDEPGPAGGTDGPPTTPATSAPTTTPETTTPSTTTPSTTTPENPPGGELPLTGGDVRGLAAIGLGIAIVGAALVLLVRRGDDAGAEV